MVQRLIKLVCLAISILPIQTVSVDCQNSTCHIILEDVNTITASRIKKYNNMNMNMQNAEHKQDDRHMREHIPSANSSTHNNNNIMRVGESSCYWRNTITNSLIPYKYETLECCDHEMEKTIYQATQLAFSTPKLGDSAKYIQRLLQISCGKSIEVIISKKNFGISTYYHGLNTCKVAAGGYFILAYATPVQHEPFNINNEEVLATVDSQEPLGSTKKANLRGDFPDARYSSSAGEVLQLQPSIENARATKPLPQLQKNKLHLPKDTHCDHKRRTGNKCCNLALYETMYRVLEDVSSSSLYTAMDSMGIVANAMKKKIQLRFQHVYEVFASVTDLFVATHHSGNEYCKYYDADKGLYLLAYATPKQREYDPDYTAREDYFSLISLHEKLGTAQTELPCQRPTHTPLILEQYGPRYGFPVGSHCTSANTGSKCCNLRMFQAMYASYQRIIAEPNYNPYDKRKIITILRDSAETVTGYPMEAIAARDDFGFKSHYQGNLICKFRVDEFYFLAYANPCPKYPLYDCTFVDNGPASHLPCPENATSVEGSTCCDQYLQYKMIKTIEEAKYSPSFNKYDTESLSRLAARSVQKDFPGSFETVLSRSDFTMKTNLYNDLTCKIDVGGYHLLSYQSSPQAPPAGDFADPAPAAAAIGAAAAASSNPSSSSAAAAAAGGGACFSLDTWVITPKGKKHMGQLEIGDFVLTANLTTPFFAPVTVWMHREPDVEEEFLTIMTEYGKTLRLTPKHLIFRNKCDEFYDEFVDTVPSDGDAVFAEELEKGDCMLLLYKEKWRQQRLMSIERTKRRGIFAPMTANGRIIVNDILASCYSDVKQGTLQTTFFYAISSIRDYLAPLFGVVKNTAVELPFFTNITKEILSLVLP